MVLACRLYKYWVVGCTLQSLQRKELVASRSPPFLDLSGRVEMDMMDDEDDDLYGGVVAECRASVPASTAFSPSGETSGSMGCGAAWNAARDDDGMRVATRRSVSVLSFVEPSVDGSEDAEEEEEERDQSKQVDDSDDAVSVDMFVGRVEGSLEPTMRGRDGFDVRHYGGGVISRPLIYPAECGIEWEEYNDALCTDSDGVFRPMRSARVMVVNVLLSFMTKSAIKASDFYTPKDVSQRRRVEACARLLSMFSAAASKGYANGNHSQLEPYKSMDAEKYAKMVHSMEPFGNYVYTLFDDNEPESKGYRAPMFIYGCEAVYDPEGRHIVAFRYWKFVNDHSYSDSAAWKKILVENAHGANCSRMNRSVRNQRNSRMMQDSKAARSMTRTSDISETGESLYLNLTNVSDLRTLYKAYAGSTEDSTGAPVFDERSLPAGITTHELYEDSEKQLGGLHPLGPETALNAQRLPADGCIGMCPLTAGMVDFHGNPVIGHDDQMHPSKYFNDEGDFVPPKFVQDKGAFKIMVNPHHTSIFDADIPYPTCGSEEPSDNILLLFWEEQKDANSVLVTARKAARSRGLDFDNWENFREEIFRAIGQQMSERDGMSKELCRAMQQSKFYGKDSFDLTEEERVQARSVPEWCSYEARTLEPFQILKQISAEINNLYGFIRRWRFERDQFWEKRLEQVKDDMSATMDAEKNQMMDHKRHTELRRSVIKLALQKMQNAFESQNHRRSIPPGFLAIWDSFQEEVKRAGAEAAKCHANRPGSMMVDPTDPESAVGSAAVGQLFGTAYNKFEVNSQGMFIQMAMNLLNGEQGIKGASTFITMAMHYAQYQVAQPMSFILAICGAGSTGKSERASLMMETQLPGWWVSGGGKSELADFNRMDDSCGRTVHLDEVTKDFTSNGPAIEKIKEITAKNSCTRSRTVKKKNALGDENWETEITFTLHYENYVITTNCGFCLQHGNEEPSDSRAPLFDRMIVFPAPPVINVTASSKDSIYQTSHTTRYVKTMDHIIQYRIVCGLTWKVLLLIKHIPDFHPANSDWAQRIMEDMDESLIRQVPNVQRCTPRKQKLRNMTLMAICVQKEVVRKFFTVEGCLQHADLQPINGYSPPWNITQLVDVIQRLNYSPADVFEAWSHALDYNPSTSSVSFHVRQMVAMSHGVAMDDRFAKCCTPAPATQAQNVSADQAARRGNVPADSVLYPNDTKQNAACLGASSFSRVQNDEDLQARTRMDDDLKNARDWADSVISGTCVYSPMSDAMNLTIEDASRRSYEMSRKRQLVCHAVKMRRDMNNDECSEGVVASLRELLKTGTGRRVDVEGHESVVTDVTQCGDLKTMDVENAVGCVLPTLNDVLCCGYEDTVLLKWLQGNDAQCSTRGRMNGMNTALLDRRLGTCYDETSWSFVCIKKDPKDATAAQFNTMWRVITRDDHITEGSGWREAARSITKGGSEACSVGTYGNNIGITESNLRDALWMLSNCKETLIGKSSNRVFVDMGNPCLPDSDAVCTASYGAMR